MREHREALAEEARRIEEDGIPGAKVALRLGTLKAWEEVRETGLHAMDEEVDRWLESWGTDEEIPAPEPHK